jgi:ACR3 family arsenite efflux pump ArsB
MSRLLGSAAPALTRLRIGLVLVAVLPCIAASRLRPLLYGNPRPGVRDVIPHGR